MPEYDMFKGLTGSPKTRLGEDSWLAANHMLHRVPNYKFLLSERTGHDFGVPGTIAWMITTEGLENVHDLVWREIRAFSETLEENARMRCYIKMNRAYLTNKGFDNDPIWVPGPDGLYDHDGSDPLKGDLMRHADPVRPKEVIITPEHVVQYCTFYHLGGKTARGIMEKLGMERRAKPRTNGEVRAPEYALAATA